MDIRPIGTEEVGAVIELWESAGLEYRPVGRDSVENLKEYFAGNADICLGAFAGDTLVGAAIGSDDGRKGWINRLAVAPRQRRKGIAAALLHKLEEALRARGRKVFAATIYSDNDASINLFRQNGFSCTTRIAYLRKADTDDF